MNDFWKFSGRSRVWILGAKFQHSEIFNSGLKTSRPFASHSFVKHSVYLSKGMIFRYIAISVMQDRCFAIIASVRRSCESAPECLWNAGAIDWRAGWSIPSGAVSIFVSERRGESHLPLPFAGVPFWITWSQPHCNYPSD